MPHLHPRIRAGGFKRGSGLLLTALLALQSLPSLEARAGLQTKFGLVTIENLQPGETYNTRELASLPMVVRNTGDKKVTVRIDVLLPNPQSPGLVQNGYEVIPSTSWVRLARDEFEIEAGASEGTDVFVTIPDDDAHLGKKYQVDFHIRTITKEFIAVGLRANLRLNMASRRLTQAETEARQKVQQYGNVDFDLLPNKADVKGVKLGEKFEVTKEGKHSLKISNPNDSDFLYYLDVVSFRDAELRMLPGYEQLPADMIVLEEKDVKVPENSIKKVKVWVKIPNEEKYRGKGFGFLIRCRVAGTPVEINQVSRYYITTEK